VKLQERCAALVSEKSEKMKQLEREKNDRAKQVAEYREEIARAQKFNTEIKDRLRKEQLALIDKTTQLEEAKIASQEAASEVHRIQLLERETQVREMTRRLQENESDLLAIKLIQEKTLARLQQTEMERDTLKASKQENVELMSRVAFLEDKLRRLERKGASNGSTGMALGGLASAGVGGLRDVSNMQSRAGGDYKPSRPTGSVFHAVDGSLLRE